MPLKARGSRNYGTPCIMMYDMMWRSLNYRLDVFDMSPSSPANSLGAGFHIVSFSASVLDPTRRIFAEPCYVAGSQMRCGCAQNKLSTDVGRVAMRPTINSHTNFVATDVSSVQNTCWRIQRLGCIHGPTTAMDRMTDRMAITATESLI